MKYIRKYVDQTSFQNFRVRSAIDKEADHAYVLQTKPDLLQVTSIITDDILLEQAAQPPLYADMVGFTWLNENTEAKGCVAITLNNDATFEIANSRTDYTLLNVTICVIFDGKVIIDLSGRLDAVLAVALRSAARHDIPILLSQQHNWDFVKDYAKEFNLEINFIFVNDHFNDSDISLFTPKKVSEIKKEYHRTVMEKVFISGVSAVALGFAFLGYTTLIAPDQVEQKEVINRVVEDPYLAYRSEIKGHHVTQDINFLVHKIGEFSQLPSWFVQSAELRSDRSYRIIFAPKFKHASVTELVEWMRVNSKEKLVIKGSSYEVINHMPAFDVDYMSAFKRYIIDSQLNFAQLKDLAIYAGLRNVSLTSNVENGNYRVMAGEISGNNLELSQIQGFYDQIAHVPIEDQGLQIKQNQPLGTFNLSQKYRLIGNLDNE